VGDTTDIFKAAEAGRIDVVAAEVGRNPQLVSSLSPEGFTPLHLAAFYGHAGVVDYLLQHEAPVNAPAQSRAFAWQSTPLHSAVAARRPEIARILLSNGADVNALDGVKSTPLYAAAFGGQIEMVRLLLEHGADINAPGADGLTPLMIARDRNHAAVAELLDQEGATD
jgi:ankyrin repeat protein